MIKITLNAPRPRWRAGIKHDPGCCTYADTDLTADQLLLLSSDKDFTVQQGDDIGSAPTGEMTDQVRLTQALCLLEPLATYLTPTELEVRISGVLSSPDFDSDLRGNPRFTTIVDATAFLNWKMPRNEDEWAGSLPKTTVLTDMVGRKVSGLERDEAWAAHQAVDGSTSDVRN